MKLSAITGLIAMVGLVTVALAEPETTHPTDEGSPKQALKAQDAAAQAGNVDADLGFYKADDDQQKKLARIIAEGDVALAKLQKTVSEKFGTDSASAVVRAAGSEDVRAVEAASEKVDGDRATVAFEGGSQTVPMVRDEGRWKISLADWLKGASASQVDQLFQSLQKLTAEVVRVTDLVSHDKFRSGEGVRDRVQRLHDSLFGSQGH